MSNKREVLIRGWAGNFHGYLVSVGGILIKGGNENRKIMYL